MKKQSDIFYLILIFTILTVFSYQLPMFQNDANFLTSNISFFITIIISLIYFFAVRRYSKRIAYLGLFLFFFIYAIFAWAMSLESETFTRSAIILTQMAILSFVIICSIIIKDNTKSEIKEYISKYISRHVVDSLDDDFQIQKNIGTKSVLTIMFIDIIGFTRIAEKYPAQEVTEILNCYFKEIIPVIKKHDGVINKFIGDAMLIVFQNDNPEIQAKNAVLAGKEIINKLKALQQIQEAEGKEKITAAIGINTGEVFVGYLGTEERCEYTVIGDTVNIASRTESANRLYKTDFLITENTYQYVKNIADVIKISNVQLRGKTEKVNIYEVLRVSEISE